MVTHNPDLEFSVIVSPQKMEREGAEFVLAPSEAERAAISDRLGLEGLLSFGGVIDLTPWGRGGWQVEGRIKALVLQKCVVTLDPFESSVEQTFVARFLPPKSLSKYQIEEEVMIGDITEEDPPELLPEEGIDIGELAVEYLSLSLDPYPRRPGMDQSSDAQEADELPMPKESPFAVLSNLKNPK